MRFIVIVTNIKLLMSHFPSCGFDATNEHESWAEEK